MRKLNEIASVGPSRLYRQQQHGLAGRLAQLLVLASFIVSIGQKLEEDLSDRCGPGDRSLIACRKLLKLLRSVVSVGGAVRGLHRLDLRDSSGETAIAAAGIGAAAADSSFSQCSLRSSYRSFNSV